TLNIARETYDGLVNDKLISDVEASISKIGTVTLDSGNDIDAAQEAYNSLDAALQERVSNYSDIETARNNLFDLRVNDVESAIKAIGTVSLESEQKILDAEAKYDEYAPDVQSAVSNINVLEKSKSELSLLKIEQAQMLTTSIGIVTLESNATIDEAKKAYTTLTKDEKEQVDNYSLLSAAEATYKALKDEADKQAAIDEARSIIRVTKVAVSNPDSAGGVELYFNFVNNAPKTIKYVYFGVTFYNAVGDVVTCEYKRDKINNCYDTGPFETGEGRNGTWWHWGDFYNWEIKSCKLVSSSMEYMDGTTRTFSEDEIGYVQY
ncbi:MAG: hypothetical protein MJ118_01930, partial [Clostridia bacterium]|nr:hypothetical protein [Clostridia bacterium]